MLATFGVFFGILALAWIYMVLRCKEKTTPGMDSIAKWVGITLFFGFTGFIVFCMVFLIVMN